MSGVRQGGYIFIMIWEVDSYDEYNAVYRSMADYDGNYRGNLPYSRLARQ